MVQGDTEKVQGGGLYGKLAVILVLVSLAFGDLIDRVVANVNGEPILESELKVASIFYGNKDREDLIKDLIDRHLLAQFLRTQGINIPEGYLNAVLHDIAKSNGKSLEQLYRDLYQEGLTPEDLKNFLSVEIAYSLGFMEYMRRKVKVSDLEIELERLKSGEVEYLREIDLLVISKGRKEDVLRSVSEAGLDLRKIAGKLGVGLERLKVRKGELVKPLDEEVWRVKVGQVAIAEDEENIYIAKVIREHRLYSGRSEEQIREEILKRKVELERKKILEKLRRESLVEILHSQGLAVSSPP